MSVRETAGIGGEPELKRQRLLDAGGPIEDDETARQKMRDAKVYMSGGNGITGFNPDDVERRLHFRGDLISPMGYFAYEGDLPMMRWLYVNGAHTQDEDVDFYIPMCTAALHGDLEACRWLYEHGASKDIKSRTYRDTSPLSIAFDESEKRELCRWFILNGALCKDDDSGDLDLGLMRKDLNRFSGSEAERPVLLKWANGRHRIREAFLVFLMGTLPPPEYSPSAMRKLLIKRLQSERATDQLLGALPCDQYQQLWTNLIEITCPANRLFGAPGVLEMIGDYVGVVRGREARIIRQLIEILPDLNAELDEDSSSSEEDE